MPDNDIVQSDIDIQNAGPTRAGFGLALLLTHDAPWGDLVRGYEDASDAVTDGFDSDHPVVRGLRAMFSQNPKPPLVLVGRVAAAVTQRYEIIVNDAEDVEYTLDLAGHGFEDAEISVTPENGDDEADIAGDLITALNAVPDKNYTAEVDGTDPNMIIVTVSAPGEWLSIAGPNPSRGLLSIRQTHTVSDVDLHGDLDAIKEINDDWYLLLTHFNSPDYAGDCAEWCAANGKAYAFDVVDNDTILDAYVDGVTDDVGSQQLALGYSGVMGSHHHSPAEFFSHAWMGEWLTSLPGQANPAWRPLEGVTPTLLTATQRTNLLARRMNYYRRAYQQSFTWEGMVFSTTYKWIDVRRNEDWLNDAIATNVVGVLAGGDVGCDAPGIQAIGGGVESALAEGVEQGALVNAPKYTLQLPEPEAVSASDKSERALRKIKWNATIRSFINKVVPIKGTLTF